MNHKYTGALHIHSKYSDGTGTIEEITLAAKKAGLSWIIINDHDCLSGLYDNKEGWYNDVAVIISEEISPGDCNHYLAFDIKKEISGEQSPEVFIKQVNEQGGFGFIAHPDESLTRKNKYKPLRWNDKSIPGFTGIEIWNHLSDWVDNYDPEKVLYCYFRKDHILTGPTANTLSWWDKLNNSNDEIIPAIGGIDVHAVNYKVLGLNFKVFSYYESFKTVANTIYLDNELSKDFGEAKRQIYDALKYGKNVIVNRAWNKGKKDFNFYLKGTNGYAFAGNTAKLDNDSRIVVELSRKARIKLLHNGITAIEKVGQELNFQDLIPGKYRVEVYYNNHPWIFTNPIRAI